MTNLEKREAVKAFSLANIPISLANHDPYARIQRYHGLPGEDILDPCYFAGQHCELPTDISSQLADYDYKFGYDLAGRPLHPWINELIKVSGVVTGTGEYWLWGPNETVDPVIITCEPEPKLLLIMRRSGRWALPGGFREGMEVVDGCVKETAEETNLILTQTEIDTAQTIYDGIVADGRVTANAWAHTHAMLFRPEAARPVVGGDDAIDARWFSTDEWQKILGGSHRKIVEFAFEDLNT
ncbi:NUDIX domain-containing protein [Candidatus Saccharibacteria bacterium]|nr:NUDIX domain-containing protein [Candidatus Saccharibacteria bacterium]MCB9821590.1 NUDIX domain-containing protein [Candidatus Nomurabacteria bacterium]